MKHTEEYAREKDQEDDLRSYRDHFLIPQKEGKEAVYFTGNSLGLQPRHVEQYLRQELKDWAVWGVEGHEQAHRPWMDYHEFLTPKIAPIVGAKNHEVVVTHSLTTNLHLLMVSFYRPTKQRYKILCEAKAFPSDQYALESQVKFHGYDPKDAIVEVAPRAGEHAIREEDILEKIDRHQNDLALIMWGGVNYYTGQFFDLEGITKAGHKAGSIVGFDLAHAAGNVPLHLHDWSVDFAAWCSYKYLNSGPGGVSGLFVHEKHADKPELPRFAGWWGHNKEKRFDMEPGFEPMYGAEGWQLSNAPVFGMAAHLASLDIFEQVGIEKLRKKSEQLTEYLEFVIQGVSEKLGDAISFEIITPKEKDRRGCQLSILCHGQGKALFDQLSAQGVVADWREPNVIRVAPAPLYNSFEDVFRFGKALERAVE